jgi:hypothetical protein
MLRRGQTIVREKYSRTSSNRTDPELEKILILAVLDLELLQLDVTLRLDAGN